MERRHPLLVALNVPWKIFFFVAKLLFNLKCPSVCQWAPKNKIYLVRRYVCNTILCKRFCDFFFHSSMEGSSNFFEEGTSTLFKRKTSEKNSPPPNIFLIYPNWKWRVDNLIPFFSRLPVEALMIIPLYDVE